MSVIGVRKFFNIIDMSPTPENMPGDFAVQFVCNGTEYTHFNFIDYGSELVFRYEIYGVGPIEVFSLVKDTGECFWYNNVYKTIEILSEPDSEISTWISNNSLPYMTRSETLEHIAKTAVDVYNAGYDKGKAEADSDEALKAWWASFQYEGRNEQSNGWIFGFCGYGWNDTTFNPIKDIRPTGNTTGLFRYSQITDLVGILERQDVVLDTSNVTTFSSMFQQCWTQTIGVIDARKSPARFDYVFEACSARSIEELVLSETITNYSGAFDRCSNLTSLKVSGVIAGSINFQWSPLDVDSMKSIISHLKNYIGTDEELAYELIFNEDCWDAIEASETSPSGYSWRAYLEVDLGWLT